MTRRGWGILALTVVALTVAGRWIDVPRIAGRIKGDEATYVGQTLSLVRDGDLKFRAEDLARFHALYGTGPEGVFLKQGQRWHVGLQAAWPPVVVTRTVVPWQQGLEYAKPFAYALAAAPFAAAGGLGGMLVLNVLLLAVCAWCAVTFCAARMGRAAGTLLGLAFFGGSVVPLYAVWLTPEIFNVTLVVVGYFLWLYKEVAPPDRARAWVHPALDWIAAGLLGIATYSKPSNALLVGPMIALYVLRGRRVHAIAVFSAFALASGLFFAANALVTGDWNFQGGNRKYFVTHFPFDQDGRDFGDPHFGNPMATEEANDENILAPSYLFPMLRHNAGYFLAGRDAGFIPYFFPGAAVLVAWLIGWRDWRLWQWLTVLACAASAVILLVLAPESWNGGGGPVGNRYFLPIYPALLFVVPPAAGWATGLSAAVAGAALVGPILIHPWSASQEVWLNPERWPLRLFPVELTIMESLPVRLTLERSRVEVCGGPKNACKDPEVFLYYMDGHTYFQEENGFWVAPGTADIVIRTEKPLTKLDLQLKSAVANEVEVSIDSRSERVTLRPNQAATVKLRPDPGVFGNHSYQIVWRIKTANGFYPRQVNPLSGDTRYLGVFITPKYSVD